MKLTNLIDNANKQNLSVMSSFWNWFNGLLIGSLGITTIALILSWVGMYELGFEANYTFKKKK